MLVENEKSVVFTEAAALKVQTLIDEEDTTNELMLRVFIQGGGCSGFQYGFTFDEKENDGDTVVTKKGVKLLIDPMSFQYLDGAEIDYTEGLEGSQFVIRNPNAYNHMRLRVFVLGLIKNVLPLNATFSFSWMLPTLRVNDLFA